MKILLFPLELFAIIAVFYCITGANFTKHPIRLMSALGIFVFRLFFLIQSLFQVQVTPPLPHTFIIIPIIFLLFKETASFKLCMVTACTLGEGIIVYFLSNLYSLLTEFTNMPSDSLPLYKLDYFVFTCFIICSLCLHKKRKIRSQILHTIDNRSYVLITISSICAFALLNTLSLTFDTLSNLGKCVMTILTILLIVGLLTTVIIFITAQYRNILLKEKDALNQKFLEMEQAHYAELERKNLDLRAFRHDFNSHILTLNNLLQEKEWERATQYIQNLSLIQTQNSYISSGNLIADAILNHYYDTLNDDVLFKVSGYFLPDCFVTDFDLCTIISNLLKNATESLENIANDEKAIYLNIDASNERILILLKNTARAFDSTELVNLQTSKSDKKNHGFGLANIQTITEKYHGFLQISYENPFFITQIVLNK